MRMITFGLFGALALGVAPGAAMAASADLSAALSGQSVPGGGDLAGTAVFFAAISPDSGRLCYRLETRRVKHQTSARIHTGVPSELASEMITLTFSEKGACTKVEPALLRDIAARPSAYYVEVLSKSYPQGALRGRLSSG